METLNDRPDIQKAIAALAAQDLQTFIGVLSPRESVVLQGRFLGQPKRSWSSLGRAMGIAQERICQLEADIIQKFEAWQRAAHG